MLISAIASSCGWCSRPASDSRWKLQGPFGKGDGRTVAQLRAERDAEDSSSTLSPRSRRRAEGLESGLYLPLYLVAVVYVVLFVLAACSTAASDERADTVAGCGFALRALAAVYVAILRGRGLSFGVRPDRGHGPRSWPS